uniref:Uncharacterized protein n=1 Tax=Timema shepardi TaxID=629360 RepID=A0A7R9ANK1_TIMSH|nr:unnamed protein product [Timema shepardi]
MPHASILKNGHKNGGANGYVKSNGHVKTNGHVPIDPADTENRAEHKHLLRRDSHTQIKVTALKNKCQLKANIVLRNYIYIQIVRRVLCSQYTNEGGGSLQLKKGFLVLRYLQLSGKRGFLALRSLQFKKGFFGFQIPSSLVVREAFSSSDPRSLVVREAFSSSDPRSLVVREAFSSSDPRSLVVGEAFSSSDPRVYSC